MHNSLFHSYQWAFKTKGSYGATWGLLCMLKSLAPVSWLAVSILSDTVGGVKYGDQSEHPMPVFSRWGQVSPLILDASCMFHFHLIRNKGASDSSTLLPTQEHVGKEKRFVCGRELGEGWRRKGKVCKWIWLSLRGQCCLQIHNPICALERGLGERWPDECRERCILIEVISLRWVSPSHESKPVSKELKMEWSLLYVCFHATPSR